MRSILLGMVVLGCLVSASAASADDTAGNSYVFVLPKTREAADHLKRGVRLYNNQSFEAAIDEFKAGALAEPCSTFDYNLGQSYRQLGRYKEALWHYQRFLGNGQPTGEVLEAVQRWVNEMQAHIANAALTMPPTEPVSDSTQVSALSARPSRTAAQSELGAHQRDDRPETVNWLGWGMTGAGVVAIGATGFLFLNSSNLDDEANRSPDTRMRNDLHEQAATRRLAGTIIGVGGLVLTATGIYMLATRSSRRDHSASASIDLGLTSRGAVVFGRF